MTARGVLRGAARLAVVPFAGVVVLVAAGGLPSWSTIAYGLLTATLLVGLATVPDVASIGTAFASSPDAAPRVARPYVRRPRGVARVSAALLTAVVIVRAFAATTGATMRHDGRFGTTMVGAVFDEGDLATTGARVLFGTKALVDDEATAPRAMREAYARLRKERGDVVSPVVPTFAGLEPAAEGVDMVVFGPETRERPRLGVVFLHGFGGGFVLPCWTVARAFADVEPSTTTACPSFRASGDWWSPDGARVLRATLAELRRKHVDRFVLVGLSNGGIGLSRLAAKLGPDARDVVGVVLVSGADPTAPPAGVPVLVVHGARDTMTSHAAAAAYAEASGATLVTLAAGHFAMLVEEERFRAAVAAFVRRLGVARADASLP